MTFLISTGTPTTADVYKATSFLYVPWVDITSNGQPTVGGFTLAIGDIVFVEDGALWYPIPDIFRQYLVMFIRHEHIYPVHGVTRPHSPPIWFICTHAFPPREREIFLQRKIGGMCLCLIL
jgi:hypothetical protein